MACTSSCATLIILLVTCGSVLSIGGFHSWKVGTLFEGLLEGLGVKIRPDAFSVEEPRHNENWRENERGRAGWV